MYELPVNERYDEMSDRIILLLQQNLNIIIDKRVYKTEGIEIQFYVKEEFDTVLIKYTDLEACIYTTNSSVQVLARNITDKIIGDYLEDIKR